jgi:uncharacterized repeat protein (TIGR01451 family)
VRTTLGFIAYEGDLGLGGDTASLNGVTLADAANQATNFFNSSIANDGVAVSTRNPSYTNTLGYDSDLLNEDGVLTNGATSASIGLTTNADQYLPGVVTFATELYAPSVALVKSESNLTHPAGPDQRGDVLHYTVIASNTGQDGADSFVLTDPIPSGTTYVPGSLTVAGVPVTDASGDDTGEFAAAANQVVARLGTGANATVGGRLAPGAAVPVSFNVRIGDVPPRFTIVNAASSTFISQSLRVPLTAISNPVTDIVAAPDLSMTKRHSPPYVAGATSTLRLVVSNVGNLASDGTAVNVTDVIPAAFTSFANVIGDGWTCSVVLSSITCTRSDQLAAGASYPPIFVDVLVPDPAPPSIVNTASVSGGGDVSPDNNTATDVGGTAQAADLQLTKQARPTTVLSGNTVTFTLGVLNAGPSTATAAVVSDPLGAGYSNIAATSTVGTCTTDVTCTLGDLAAGESATITIVATVNANATTLTNAATVSSPTPDPNPDNNNASASVVVAPTADLQLTKTPSTFNPSPGQHDGLTYTIVATNAGPSDAEGVVIDDTLPSDFTPDTIVGPPGFGCVTNADRITCSGGTITVGASVTLTVTGTVDASATDTMVNTADVRADTADPDLTNNTATVTVIPRPQADIGVTKLWGNPTGTFASIDQAPPDSDVRVQLSMTNFGPSLATDAVLVDQLPPHVTFISSDHPGVCDGTGNVITCSPGALAVGATFTVLATVHVELSAAGTTLDNSVSGAADQPDPVDANDSASASLTVGRAADLAMQKRVSESSAVVGDTVTFTLAVTNTGPDDADDVEITDQLPIGLSFVSSSDCTFDGVEVTCNVGTLAAGDTVERTFDARVQRAAAGTAVTNTATVTSTTPDPNADNNVDSQPIVVAPQADLSVVKTAAATTVDLFQDVTYTLAVSNGGPNDATGDVIIEPVPAGMVFVSADTGCAFSAASAAVICNVGVIPVDASRSVTVTLRPQAPNAGTFVTNTALVRGDVPDPDPSNNTSSATIFVRPQADLAITKTASAPSVIAGGRLTYTLLVSNAGPNTAPSVAVDDPLAARATAVSASATQGTCTVTPARVTCALGDLASGGQAQVLITVAVAASAGGTTLTNTATVSSTITDPRPHDNTASVSTPVTALSPVLPVASLTITKQVDRTHATTADRLTYHVVVANTGTAAAAGVVVTDTFARRVVVVSAATPDGTCRRTPLSCTIVSLAPGARATITIVARAETAGRLTNGASATATNASGVQAAPVSTTVVLARTSLSLQKRASRQRVSAGQNVSFGLTVRNLGANPAFRVRVCDRLPAGLTFRSAPRAQIQGLTACWTIAALAGHASRTVTLSARADNVRAVTSVLNRATAKATNTGSVASSASVTIVPVASRGGGVTG